MRRGSELSHGCDGKTPFVRAESRTVPREYWKRCMWAHLFSVIYICTSTDTAVNVEMITPLFAVSAADKIVNDQLRSSSSLIFFRRYPRQRSSARSSSDVFIINRVRCARLFSDALRVHNRRRRKHYLVHSKYDCFYISPLRMRRSTSFTGLTGCRVKDFSAIRMDLRILLQLWSLTGRYSAAIACMSFSEQLSHLTLENV